MKFDHATGDCGGVEVPSEWMPCSCASRAKLRMRSGYFAIVSARISGSRPSMPSTTRRAWRVGPSLGRAAAATSVTDACSPAAASRCVARGMPVAMPTNNAASAAYGTSLRTRCQFALTTSPPRPC